tara:strand:+ start:286 stop:777 length:492 start_codon:yes stop_codon:yes gene_type:complete
MDYKKQYLKYKLKYLILKKSQTKIYGGAEQEKKQGRHQDNLTDEDKKLGLLSIPPFGLGTYAKLQIFDDYSDSNRTRYIMEDNFNSLKDKFKITDNGTIKCNASGKKIEVYKLEKNPPSPPLSSEKPPHPPPPEHEPEPEPEPEPNPEPLPTRRRPLPPLDDF